MSRCTQSTRSPSTPRTTPLRHTTPLADKGNEEWTEGLAAQGLIKQKKSWHPWYVGEARNMPAGYATTYTVSNSTKDFSFVTIRLAGHMVRAAQPHRTPRQRRRPGSARQPVLRSFPPSFAALSVCVRCNQAASVAFAGPHVPAGAEPRVLLPLPRRDPVLDGDARRLIDNRRQDGSGSGVSAGSAARQNRLRKVSDPSYSSIGLSMASKQIHASVTARVAWCWAVRLCGVCACVSVHAYAATRMERC